MGFSANAIFEFYKKQGLDLRADLKKVPNNNHENLVHFHSNCTLAGLLCSRMLPLVPAARRCNQRRHRQRQRPDATAAALRWAGPSRHTRPASLQRCRYPAPSIIACALAIPPSELDLRIQVGLGTQLIRPET